MRVHLAFACLPEPMPYAAKPACKEGETNMASQDSGVTMQIMTKHRATPCRFLVDDDFAAWGRIYLEHLGQTLLFSHMYPNTPESFAIACEEPWDEEMYDRAQAQLEASSASKVVVVSSPSRIGPDLGRHSTSKPSLS